MNMKLGTVGMLVVLAGCIDNPPSKVRCSEPDSGCPAGTVCQDDGYCHTGHDAAPGADGFGDAAPGADGFGPITDAEGVPPIGDGGDQDRYEPNDTFVTAVAIVPGTYPNLAIQPADDSDFYQFSLAAPRDVVVEINGFISAEGDLELRLYDEFGNPVGASTTVNDVERIVRTTATGGQLGPGTFTIEVFSFQSQFTNGYTLLLTVM